MGTPGDEHPGRKGGWRGATSSLAVVTPSGAQDPVDVPHGLACLLQTQMWWERCWLLLSHRQRVPANTLLTTTVTAVGLKSALQTPLDSKSKACSAAQPPLPIGQPVRFAATWLDCPVWSHRSKMSRESSQPGLQRGFALALPMGLACGQSPLPRSLISSL